MIEIQMAEKAIKDFFQGDLATFSLDDRQRLPKSSGVYIATSTNKSDGIFYVGKAKNFRDRCNKKHQRLEVAQKMGAELLALVPIECGNAWRVEQVLIDRLKPKINKACIRW